MIIEDPVTGLPIDDTIGVFGPPSSSGYDTTGNSDNSSTGDGFMSALGGLLPGISNTITSIYKTANPPRPVSLPPGSAIWNAQQGRYVPATGFSSTGISPTMLLIFGAVVLILVLKR